MGVTLDLRLIDHDRLAVRGLRAVNEAIEHGDAERLRTYLTELPIEVDAQVVDLRTERLAKLRAVNAPKILIENEERLLRFATGEAYQPQAYQNASLDELRELLGTWCWMSACYSLDKTWKELEWFLEPLPGPADAPLVPVRPTVGDPRATVFTKALQGEADYPKDVLGDPIIRTLGSREPGCSGYNPPRTCAVIAEALRRVQPDSWEEYLPLRRTLYRRAIPDLDEADIAELVANELLVACDAFAVLVATYDKALAKGYGVSCEYSL